MNGNVTNADNSWTKNEPLEPANMNNNLEIELAFNTIIDRISKVLNDKNNNTDAMGLIDLGLCHNFYFKRWYKDGLP